MKRFPCFFVFSILFTVFGFVGRVLAEDVVYLNDGSVIHGTITEEIPGKSIKIETKDGNIFVYKMRDIEKITHSKPDESTGTDNSASQASPALTPVFSPAVKIDPHAKFSKFAFMVNAGFWNPGVFSDANSFLETAAGGSTSYDFVPGWVKGGLGIGWFTNGIGLKWNVELSYQPNDYQYSGYYWDGYQYISYSGTVSTYLFIGGSELEADICMDNVVNADNVTSLYIPLIVGAWDVQYGYDDGYTNDIYTGTTTDIGTGIGFRGFDSSKFMWDFQIVYRACNRGNDLVDGSGYKIPLPDGKFMDADISGLDLNFTVGLVM
jgi:hypothetical protein